MKDDNSRSNTLIVLAGNSAFFLFSAQQIVSGAIAATPFGPAIVAVPLGSSIGIVCAYISLALPDFLLTHPNKRLNFLTGLAHGVALGILFALLAISTYTLTKGAFDGAVRGAVERTTGEPYPNPLPSTY